LYPKADYGEGAYDKHGDREKFHQPGAPGRGGVTKDDGKKKWNMKNI
jgi:hypothetical protein